jgi:hypothetical protein
MRTQPEDVDESICTRNGRIISSTDSSHTYLGASQFWQLELKDEERSSTFTYVRFQLEIQLGADLWTDLVVDEWKILNWVLNDMCLNLIKRLRIDTRAGFCEHCDEIRYLR